MVISSVAFYVATLVAWVGGITVGLRASRTVARWTLAVVVAASAAGMTLVISRVLWAYFVLPDAALMFFAAGLLGPALSKRLSLALPISALAAGGAIILAGWLLIYAACLLGDCI